MNIFTKIVTGIGLTLPICYVAAIALSDLSNCMSPAGICRLDGAMMSSGSSVSRGSWLGPVVVALRWRDLTLMVLDSHVASWALRVHFLADKKRAFWLVWIREHRASRNHLSGAAEPSSWKIRGIELRLRANGSHHAGVLVFSDRRSIPNRRYPRTHPPYLSRCRTFRSTEGRAGRHRVHDLHDHGAAGQLFPDGSFRRPARLHALQRRGASRRAGIGRSALRLPPAEASLRRQVHAGRRATTFPPAMRCG